MAILSLLFLSFFSLSSFISPYTSLSQSSLNFSNAIEILSNSGYLSMALTLQMTSGTLIPSSSSATIFSPSDAAFIRSGQPSLGLLQYHLSPLKFSPETLKSLTFGTRIPTHFPNHSLIITTSAWDGQISINNIKINESTIYDDGSLIIYGMDRFFDPSFQISFITAPAQSPSFDLSCTDLGFVDSPVFGIDSLTGASDLLKSRGYSVMASFLDLQFLGLTDRTKITVFAPIDSVLEGKLGNFSEYALIFGRHVVPCKLGWTDLVKFDEGTELKTFSDGFTINVTRSGDLLLLNEAPVTFPDIYFSESLVVHGLHQMIMPIPDDEEQAVDSFFEEIGNDKTIGGFEGNVGFDGR